MTEGRDLAEVGAQRALDHADRNEIDWSGRAWGLLLDYVRRLRIRDADKRFMAEEVREWAQGQGLPKPPDPRAWGALFSRARRAGWITSAGYTESKNKQAHCRPTQLWRVTEP